MTQPSPADELAAETVALAEAVGRDRFAAYLDKYRATVRATVLREAADRVWALADRTSEAGLGALQVAADLRRMADGSQP